MNIHNTPLSQQSKTFLEDLRVYLFSSGKNTDEIEEVVEELTDHLLEAEKKGKSIEGIIGQSPKEYMEQISNEMPVDYMAWFKYIPIIILVGFSITILSDLGRGKLIYSVLEVVGYLLIAGLFLLATFTGLKYVSGNHFSIRKQALIFGVLGGFPMLLFVGLIYLNRMVETPTIHFGLAGSIVIGVMALILIIAVSIWAKTWILIIIPALFALPDVILNQTALQENTQLLLSSFISLGGIAVFLFISFKMSKD
ncbi:DNA-binding ferritin-like protein (Dps family) [Virgibacillus halotolerans]|uniref:HAAS domain-containing protein n=1 Tax=Virgibacillus halotolerans TaxID=1071053 RepID=UPI001960122E|nr:hypothetical protein [Virgibacillus halotolerans]MBM7600888.1 DNA-binding ferritin-like protein (Dps family) [Virgibacillus halotolerans]